MPRDRDACPLCFDDPDGFARLRDVLARARYTDAGVIEALGLGEVRPISQHDVPLLLRVTATGSPLHTLIRLFLIAVATDAEVTRRAIAPMTLEGWAEAGLVELQGDSVLAAVQLLPYQRFVIASDLLPRAGQSLRPDHVMGVGRSSTTLAALTVRRPSRLTLDLGTGSGFQAFLASPHSARVLATDRNPRAVNLATFNALLNQYGNVEVLQGDLFEPVQGRQFDLVVSNPPFVISPETRFIYRDSGSHGEEVTHTIVRQAPPYLAEGGFCQILCNWAHVKGWDWKERLATWFEGSGCDAWVLHSETLEPGAYACKWIRHTERDTPEEFARRFDRWMAFYDELGIEALSGGLVTLRRRSAGPNWFRVDTDAGTIQGSASDSILRGFASRDFLDSMTDDRLLLDQCLTLAPEVRLDQRFQPSPDGWALDASELRLLSGLTCSGTVDPYMASLLAHCDGTRPLRTLVTDMAALLGQDPASVTPAALGILRRLLDRGFLLPPASAPPP